MQSSSQSNTAAASSPQGSALASRVCFVLVEPSHAGNIGSAARAIRAMGFEDLRVVNPREEGFAQHEEGLAFASGAADVLEATKAFDTLPKALSDVTLAIGLSAQGREFAAPPQEVQQVLPRMLNELQGNETARVGFVFGTERTGLSIAQAQLCHELCYIETREDASSLNVAQSVQVVAYLARMALGIRRSALGAGFAVSKQAKDPGVQLATIEQTDAAIDHLERALKHIGYLDPLNPKRMMPRLRRLFNRTRLEQAELDILRGLAAHLEKQRV